MAGSKTSNNPGMESPMDILFSWSASPGSAESSRLKRKMEQEDSGYVTPSFSFHHKSKREEGETSTGESGFVSLTSESPYTGKVLRRECPRPCFPSPAEDSYVEFLYGETSLYPEESGINGTQADDSSVTGSGGRGYGGVLEESMEVEAPLRSFTCPERWASRRVGERKATLSEPPPGARRRLLLGSGRERASLAGADRVDLLYHLGVASNQYMAVTRILDYLSDSDVSAVTMVSKSWRRIALGDPRTRDRWAAYVKERRNRKENLRVVIQSNKLKSSLAPLAARNHSTPLKTSQPTSPPVSPSKVRFHLFQKEAKKLKNGEILMQCPRCSNPSVCDTVVKCGTCVRVSCGLRFCTVCLRSWHEGMPCDGYFTPLNTTPTKRKTRIGSKESKRNLRRL